MHIVVCIKQVPVVSAMTFDLETKTLKREGVPLEVSSFDIRALLKAVELRDRHGGEVTVLTASLSGRTARSISWMGRSVARILWPRRGP
jgi:electron transfer flavoprotein alpha/beta subunit